MGWTERRWADVEPVYAAIAEHLAPDVHVTTTARYEWMSWDAAGRREGWPV
jgi:hypothetical protein